MSVKITEKELRLATLRLLSEIKNWLYDNFDVLSERSCPGWQRYERMGGLFGTKTT